MIRGSDARRRVSWGVVLGSDVELSDHLTGIDGLTTGVISTIDFCRGVASKGRFE
jgi:hypothetical protein